MTSGDDEAMHAFADNGPDLASLMEDLTAFALMLVNLVAAGDEHHPTTVDVLRELGQYVAERGY